MGIISKLILIFLLTYQPEGVAQMWSRVEADPNVPVKAGFDTKRAIFWAEPNFVPLRDPTWIPLKKALKSGDVNEDVPVLTLKVGGQVLVLITSQMSYHHIAQGEIAGEPWMVTF